MITLSLCVLLFFTCVQGKRTTCITTVPSTRSPTLTCFFSEDVSHTKKDFTVHRHYGNSSTAVVDCAWDIHSDTPQCITEEGYTFNGIVTDQMTVEISRVTKGESRKYTCELSGSKPEYRSFCDLSTDVTTCEIQSVQLMSNTTLTCHFPEDITNSKGCSKMPLVVRRS